ncbi:MAG: hypothetical protein ACRDHW_00460 [Ktedonobacteraceae bacterium]
MALKNVPQEYQPQKGDVRTRAADGAFQYSVHSGVSWVDLVPVSTGRPASAVTEGMTNLGRRDGAFYWRVEQAEQAAPAGWPWQNKKTENNAGWRAPRYGLGQLVWLRSSPRQQPKLVTGILLVPAYQDHPYGSEDEDLSSPQSWEYHFAEGGSEEEDRLVGRSELPGVLASQPVPVAASDDFDPFLDDGDLP